MCRNNNEVQDEDEGCGGEVHKKRERERENDNNKVQQNLLVVPAVMLGLDHYSGEMTRFTHLSKEVPACCEAEAGTEAVFNIS